MNRKDFIKGSTYCFDSTAYQALKNLEKEEKEMENRTGEIWEIEMVNGTTKEAIVVKDHGGCSNILLLADTDNGHCDIEVVCRGTKYSNSQLMQYCFNSRLTGFVRKLTAAEFKKVRDSIAVTLGFQETKEIVKEVVKEVPQNPVELEIAKAKLETYKTMYNDLLQMTLKGAAV